MRLDCGYRLDLLGECKVVVEIKAVESLLAIHEAQLLTYLRLGGWKVGLLINFNSPPAANPLPGRQQRAVYWNPALLQPGF
jgi:GxxExxY protein